MSAERFTLTIEANGSNMLPIVRQALKLLARRFGLRCIVIERVEPASIVQSNQPNGGITHAH